MYQTEIPIVAINEDELQDLINKLVSISGQKVKVERRFVISTESLQLSSMLDSLADALANERQAELVRKNGHKKSAKSDKKKIGGGGEKKEPTRGPHVRSIMVISTGEMISRFELNHRLKAHSIEPGTELHSPKYGEIVVQADRSSEQPYFVVNESNEIV